MESGKFPVFNCPWRAADWDGRNQTETFLKDFKINNPEVSHLRILLQGSTGAEMSSFVNSVRSAFKHRITVKAPTASNTTAHCTKKVYSTLQSHSIRHQDGGTLHSDMCGIHPDDVINALTGHLQENFVFNPLSPLTNGDPGYISNTALNDEAHCLVFVLSATHVGVICNDTVRKLRSIRARASDLGIPQAVVLTNVDACCPLVCKDLKNIYKSGLVKKKMQNCCDILGIPMNQIFPVKNYHEELDTNNDMDVLIFQALKQIINWANDYVTQL